MIRVCVVTDDDGDVARVDVVVSVAIVVIGVVVGSFGGGIVVAADVVVDVGVVCCYG